jgi:hypothetical protein
MLEEKEWNDQDKDEDEGCLLSVGFLTRDQFRVRSFELPNQPLLYFCPTSPPLPPPFSTATAIPKQVKPYLIARLLAFHPLLPIPLPYP